MTPDQSICRAMRGEPGPLLGAMRLALTTLSMPYGWAVERRNRRFDKEGRSVRVPVPVISIGNITAGGTGKTPLVIDIARRLMNDKRKVGVVARGYGAAQGQINEEVELIRRRLPDVVCVSNPDRVAAARRAVSDFDVDCLIADDAFQHRQLHRDLDVVVIDATCPFGYGHLLPRGLLREPITALRRAHLIVVSRTDTVPGHELVRLEAELDRVAGRIPRLHCRHAFKCMIELARAPRESETLETSYPLNPVFVSAAIGNPSAFLATVKGLQLEVAGHHWWTDHHAFSWSDIKRLANLCRTAKAASLLVTEKDAIKLEPKLTGGFPCPVYAVRIEIDFLEDGDTILNQALRRILR